MTINTNINDTDLDELEESYNNHFKEVTELSVTDIVSNIVSTMETKLTAYKLAVVINATFRVLNINIEIRPQMMYNYARNGLIVKGVKGTTTYTHDQAITFVTRFVEKRVNK